MNRPITLLILWLLSGPLIVQAQTLVQVLPVDADDGFQYYYQDISCSDDHNCTLPGYSFELDSKLFRLLIERTFDGGLTWTRQSAPYPARKADIFKNWRGAYAFDSLCVFAFGDSGLIARTTDAGMHWEDRSIPSPWRLRAAHFIDSRNGMIGGAGGLAVITSDGGDTWRSVEFSKRDVISSVKMFSRDTCVAYAYGSGPIYYTHDGWKTIDSLPRVFDWYADSGRVRNISELIWRDRNEIVAYGGVQYARPDQNPEYENHPYVMRLSDGGKSWQEVYDKDSHSEYTNDMDILPGGVGIAGGRGFGLMRTSDWGRTWSDDTLATDVGFIDVSCVAMLDEQTALIDLSAFGQGKIMRVTYPDASVDGLREKVLYGTAIYPNPAVNNIAVKKLYNNERGYSVIDMLGRVVMRGKLNYGPGTTSLDCAGLLDGSYTLMVQFDEGNLPAGHFVILK